MGSVDKIGQYGLLFRGIRSRDAGIKQASDHAGPSWNDRAFNLLVAWLDTRASGHQFMMEEFREAMNGKLADPPHKRAFGALAVRAKRDGLIKSVGLQVVSNPDAHRCYANQWEKI